ncbi:MAG TPA: hypothetical protein VMI06_08410 [Terriglobia bacterium]|nr:hypothetical protein [Terriglobia bacterium]
MRYIRKLRGGSQPILAGASDGHFYIVKFTNNLQGPNLAFNESMGAELYRALRLPVPFWRPLEITDKFIDRNPACWMETETGMLRPSPGVCFASRYLGDAETRLFEILPGNRFLQIENLKDFWLAWLVDICAGHADNRQAIFREEGNGQLNAVFIDHGHMFRGPKGDEERHFRASAYLDLRIYQGTSSRFLVKLRKSVGNLDAEVLWKEAEYLPEAWKTDSALQSFARCLETLSSAGLVAGVLDMIAGFRRPTDQRGSFDLQPEWQPPPSVLRPGIQAAGSVRSFVA